MVQVIAGKTKEPPPREGRIRHIQQYISRMPSLSTTVSKVMEICNRPDASPNDLNRVISLDPVLTGLVLKLINSAYYSLPNQVTSLARAIIMLGLNTVKNLALSTAILQTVGGKDSFKALSMDEFWTHSITVGVTAKAISALKGIPGMQREEYFVSGLLHDLGKIPLSNCFPEEYGYVMEIAGSQGSRMHGAEEKILGMTHCLVGGMIADKWELGGGLRDALHHHHDPDLAPEESQTLVSIVALADTCTHAYEGNPENCNPLEDSLLSSSLGKTGVSVEDLDKVRESVLKEIDKAKIFLQATQG
ncbi:MAG: metal-dependent phosphohydrolase [Deltaproteobacteria bacterium HGW-Deltaproteobacteria-21]|nr:MAG: metal-dependent phosphohydrolase [Deltaproteobacteria bacterium HGW-Deltaproteobacteria-21]